MLRENNTTLGTTHNNLFFLLFLLCPVSFSAIYVCSLIGIFFTFCFNPYFPVVFFLEITFFFAFLPCFSRSLSLRLSVSLSIIILLHIDKQHQTLFDNSSFKIRCNYTVFSHQREKSRFNNPDTNGNVVEMLYDHITK